MGINRVSIGRTKGFEESLLGVPLLGYYLNYYLAVRENRISLGNSKNFQKRTRLDRITLNIGTTLSTRNWTKLIFLPISPLITFSRKLTQPSDT